MTASLPPIPPRRTPQTGLPPISEVPSRPEGLPPLGERRQRPRALPPLGATPVDPPEGASGPTGTRRGRRLGLAAVAAGALVAAGAVGGIVGAGIGDDGGTAASAPSVTTASTSVPGRTVTGTLASAVSLVTPSVVVVRTSSGQGSGVIVAPRNLVVTNEHVVSGEDRVELVTNDGRRLAADVVVHDARDDLAVLRPVGVVPQGVALADPASGALRVGDQVFAVGSPYGLQNSVTAGIVSALDRAGDAGVPMIQTDAPINPGNSGGGLFDLDGRLVGIPTSIRAPIDGNVGIGFATPVSRVSTLLAQIP